MLNRRNNYRFNIALANEGELIVEGTNDRDFAYYLYKDWKVGRSDVIILNSINKDITSEIILD